MIVPLPYRTIRIPTEYSTVHACSRIDLLVPVFIGHCSDVYIVYG